MGLAIGGEYKPYFALATSSGIDITQMIANSLESFTLTESAGEESDRFTLIIARPPNLSVPKLGEELILAIGFPAYLVHKGKFTVSDVSINGSPAEIGITAYATPFSDRKKAVAIQSQKTRAFDETQLGDIIKTIAADNNLIPKIGEKFIDIAVDHIVQMDESDANFCSRMALKYGSGFNIANDSLVFTEKNTGKTASGISAPPVLFEPSMLSSWQATFGSRYTAKTIKAKYRDQENGLTKTFQLGSGDPVIILPFISRTEKEAVHAAESRQKESQAADNSIDMTMAVTINATALNAGGKMILTNFDPAVDGDWFAQTVEYNYSSSGFTLRIHAVNEKPANEQPAS